MGCDIHIVVERKRKAGGPWVGMYSSDACYPIIRSNMIAAQRDYAFFGALAAVRGEPVEGTMYPRNLPEDMSELTRQQFWRCPTDYHSASHSSPKYFAAMWLFTNAAKADGFQAKSIRVEHAVYDLLGIGCDEDDFEFRVVFWFDN